MCEPGHLVTLLKNQELWKTSRQWSSIMVLQLQRKLLRATAMMSAVPCIATLLELVPSVHPASPEGTMEGRVLLQNDLSQAYWGKLSTKAESGVWSLI